MPFYSFQTNKLVHQSLFKSILCFLTLVFTTLFIIYKFDEIGKPKKGLYLVLLTIHDVSGLVLEIFTILNSAYCIHKWQVMFSKMHYLELEINGYVTASTEGNKYVTFFKNVDFLFAGSFHLMLNFVLDYIYFKYSVMQINKYITSYFTFLITIVAYNIALFVKGKLNGINILLYTFKPSAVLNYSVTKRFTKFKMLLVNTYDIVENFNDLCGCSLIIVFLHVISKILILLLFLLRGIQSDFEDMDILFVTLTIISYSKAVS